MYLGTNRKCVYNIVKLYRVTYQGDDVVSSRPFHYPHSLKPQTHKASSGSTLFWIGNLGARSCDAPKFQKSRRKKELSHLSFGRVFTKKSISGITHLYTKTRLLRFYVLISVRVQQQQAQALSY